MKITPRGILIWLLFAATSIAASPENNPSSQKIDIPRSQLSVEQQKKALQVLAEAQPLVMTFAAAFPDASFRVWRLDSKSQHVLIDMEVSVNHEYLVTFLYDVLFDENITKVEKSHCAGFDASVISDLAKLQESGVYHPVKLTLKEMEPLCADPEGFLKKKIQNDTKKTVPFFFCPDGWALGTEFPGEPKQSENHEGDSVLRSATYEASSDEAFSLGRAINPVPIFQDRIAAAYDGAKKGMLARTGATLISEEEIKVLGHDSRRYVCSLNDGNLILEQRMVIIGNELYIFAHIHPKNHFDSSATAAFFDKISEKKKD